MLRNLDKRKILEWFGVLTAIIYSLLVASNTGFEFIAFSLLLISAFAIGFWAYLHKHWGVAFLEIFYALAGLLGMFSWY